jgi:hypothetical protein
MPYKQCSKCGKRDHGGTKCPSFVVHKKPRSGEPGRFWYCVFDVQKQIYINRWKQQWQASRVAAGLNGY